MQGVWEDVRLPDPGPPLFTLARPDTYFRMAAPSPRLARWAMRKTEENFPHIIKSNGAGFMGGPKLPRPATVSAPELEGSLEMGRPPARVLACREGTRGEHEKEGPTETPSPPRASCPWSGEEGEAYSN